jgi:hypothetical protein
MTIAPEGCPLPRLEVRKPDRDRTHCVADPRQGPHYTELMGTWLSVGHGRGVLGSEP